MTIIKSDNFSYLSKIDISGTDFRIFFYLIDILNNDYFTCISQQDIGNEIKLSRQQVNKSIKKLLEKELIIKGKSIGNQQTYKINSKYLKVKKGE